MSSSHVSEAQGTQDLVTRVWCDAFERFLRWGWGRDRVWHLLSAADRFRILVSIDRVSLDRGGRQRHALPNMDLESFRFPQ
jgi:hypothetical protein